MLRASIFKILLFELPQQFFFYKELRYGNCMTVKNGILCEILFIDDKSGAVGRIDEVQFHMDQFL
ncbi:hypothetical protein LCGC14_0957400 [marine sediment metagenome]|uniref:Uncharacterized protein n=1 Tax=marine sediment metagenome TaxID=412755 RepID=A0A0F9RM04_9ZZZZ